MQTCFGFTANRAKRVGAEARSQKTSRRTSTQQIQRIAVASHGILAIAQRSIATTSNSDAPSKGNSRPQPSAMIAIVRNCVGVGPDGAPRRPCGRLRHHIHTPLMLSTTMPMHGSSITI